MTKLNEVRPSIKSDGHRNTDKIRQDIAQAEQEMSHTVEQIGDRIKEKLDWQEYVKDTPYVALGIAAGLGFLAAGMFIKKRTPIDRILDSIADEVRHSAGGMVARTARPGIIKVTLLGIASKAAVNWLRDATNAESSKERKEQPGAGPSGSHQDSAVDSQIIV
ncbi:MAG: hypothetical protein WBB23_09070 [Desulforhopalus sp.]